MRIFVSAAYLLFLYFVFIGVCHAENAVSFGYGFGAWNGQGMGRVEQKRPYDYATLSYVFEHSVTHAITFVLEPFIGFDNRPDNGIDTGFTVYAKVYFPESSPENRFYLTAGTGAAYTTVGFEEQGTHGLFILQGGIGYRMGCFFLENRFRHYSNGGLTTPNRSVNSNLLMVGCYF